jgi:NAD(P)-dependent dehydrogenase (short-subunit alcohol dehydrogenase family)
MTEQAGIDPHRLATCLEVLAQVDQLPHDHPDVVRIRLATARIFKTAKRQRRREKRDEIVAADRAVDRATATAAPHRFDDETQGIALVSPAAAASAGTLRRPRSCYICKQPYTVVDAFYHQLCPPCAQFNHDKRAARTDLTGRRALLTGGRAKIGMYIALRLLRDGAHTTITTRFPQDAARRFTGLADSADWLHRLKIVGLDLRDPAQVLDLADEVAADGPLDILINNACQTVRRSPGAYSHLVRGEAEELAGGPRPQLRRLGEVAITPHALISALGADHDGLAGLRMAPDLVAALALQAGSATLDRIVAGTAIDAGGLVPDRHESNSWVHVVHEVEPLELLEVQLCNVIAPFLLVSRLRPALAQSTARRKYVVNVSAMEGSFGRGYKAPGHPHTNMAKAALNMLTRTSAGELLSDRILMTAVDTGWITDERPHPTKVRLNAEGFRAPLDLVDGAARVYDPIVRGEAGEDLSGIFLKDYRAARW